MKKIINTYHKKLIFPTLDFSIESNEIKIVTDSFFLKLIYNPWLKEIIHENQKKNKKIKKGRKK